MPQRKISRGPPELINIIHRVSNIHNVEVLDHVIRFGCDDIDSYSDGYYKVSLRGNRDGQKIRWVYLIKWHSEPNRRIIFREGYKREVLFYTRVVPLYLEIQRRFKLIEGLKIKFPNCYFASAEWNKEALVFTSPYVQGYRLHNRLVPLNLDHVALVMKNLAKLHALSFVLEHCYPAEFEAIINECYVDAQYSELKQVSYTVASFFNESINVVKDKKLRKTLQHSAADFLPILKKCVMPNKRKHLVICHGDCWNNNVLFKYQNQTPVDVMLIDCSLLRYASPVSDISYYLYMSTCGQFLSAHYDRVVNLYYNTLSAILRQCNMEPNDIYPEQVFLQDLKVYSVFGLIEALVSMKIITAEPEEALKMTEMKYDESKEKGAIFREEQNNQCYVERVNAVVNDFFSRNYSLDLVLGH